MKTLIIMLVVFLTLSCSQKTHTWEGKKVTERKFNKKLKKHTHNFIKENPEMIELFEDIKVEYDTTKIKLSH